MPVVKLNKDRLTYVDVARLAGVTPATVSRVLNNASNVAPRTRARVLKAIRATGYKPLSAARMLARQRHETIGLIFEREHTNSYYGARLMEGISQALTENGLKLAMGAVSWSSRAEEIERLPLLSTVSVDGLILDVAQISGDVDAVVAKLGLPYVYVNLSGSRPCNTIMPDDVAGGETATQYLIDAGHRNIAYIPCYHRLRHSCQADRMKGYVQAMTRASLPPIPLWDEPLKWLYGRDDEYLGRTKLFREKYGVTAIVTHAMFEAVRTLFACYQLGLKAPRDMTIVACDMDPTVWVAPVAIPCVHFDRLEMGKLAVEMLLRRIANSGQDVPTHRYRGKLVEEPRSWRGDGRVDGMSAEEGKKP